MCHSQEKGSVVSTSISGYSTLDFSAISGDITFTGLGSGTDFQEVIDGLMEVEEIHKTRMELWATEWEEKITSIESLTERLKAVEEAAAAMDTLKEFLVRQATSSNTDVITASVSNAAAAGAYSVTVAEDSQHIIGTAGVDAATSQITRHAAGSEDLVISVGGVEHTIAIAANATITEVAQAIDDYFSSDVAPANADEVTAYVEDDGSGGRAYRLVLQSNIGGEAGEIEVLKNPLTLSFDSKDAALYQDWSSGSGPAVTVGGMFTGSSEDLPGGQDYFSYRVYNTEAAARTVGADEITLGYEVTTASGVVSGTVTVPADYADGDSIELHNGILLQLEAGETIGASDDFYLTAYCNDIDAPNTSTDWTGTATVSALGNYTGAVNKTYTFTVMSDDGALADTDPSDSLTLRWSDSTGDTGTIEVAYSAANYELEQGIYLNLGAGTFVEGDTFTMDVFAPERQAAQAEGLAQVSKVVHAGFSDQSVTPVTSEAGGDKTFTYVYAGEEINVTVPGGTTLAQLANIITSDENNPGVRASVINDGLGLPNSYKLVITGEDTGAENQISAISHDFDSTAFESAAGDLGGGFTTTQKATNSMIRVDGFPTSPNYLQRDSNVVSDVITGLSMDLHDAGTSQITVSTDIDAVADTIEAFVNAVNYAQNFIRQETKYNAATTSGTTLSVDDTSRFEEDEDDANGVMIGNYGYQIIKSRLDSILSSSISGLVDGSDAYTHLSQIGITTDPDNDGIWVIDSTMLTEALTSDSEAVANLFINNTDKGTAGVAKQMYDEMEVQTGDTGITATLKSNYEGIIKNISARIEREERRLDLVRARYELRFTNLETTLATLNNQATSLESQIEQLPD